jgi:hypothetical protein
MQASSNIQVAISTTVGVGVAIDVSLFRRWTVFWQDNGSTGTWFPEISPDNTNWYSTGFNQFVNGITFTVGSDVIDASFTNQARACGAVARYFRARCTSYTSGTPTAIMIGELY